jgi:hypothetical protein
MMLHERVATESEIQLRRRVQEATVGFIEMIARIYERSGQAVLMEVEGEKVMMVSRVLPPEARLAVDQIREMIDSVTRRIIADHFRDEGRRDESPPETDA